MATYRIVVTNPDRPDVECVSWTRQFVNEPASVETIVATALRSFFDFNPTPGDTMTIKVEVDARDIPDLSFLDEYKSIV